MKSVFLAVLMLVAAAQISAHSATDQMSEKASVGATSVDTVSVNGVKTYVYDLDQLDSQPDYPGGIRGIMMFLAQNLVYPAKAVEEGVQGRVLVSFVVTKDGKVADARVVRSVCPDLDAEALRVVRMIKGFTPGTFKGKKVDVRYNLPVTFRLNNAGGESK